MDLLRQNVENVLTALTVALKEAEEIQAQRKALEASGYAISDREKKIYTREVEINRRETDIEAQKKYIEEQNHNTQLVLNKITIEKESLREMAGKKQDMERGILQYETDKKALSFEREKLQRERDEFEKEKTIIKKLALANQEHKERLDILQKRLDAEQTRLQNIHNSI